MFECGGSGAGKRGHLHGGGGGGDRGGGGGGGGQRGGGRAPQLRAHQHPASEAAVQPGGEVAPQPGHRHVRAGEQGPAGRGQAVGGAGADGGQGDQCPVL